MYPSTIDARSDVQAGWQQREATRALRVAVLASGRGSNLQAIIDAIQCDVLDVEIVTVLSDHAEAPALERARRAGIDTQYIVPGGFRTRLSGEAEKQYIDYLDARQPDLVFLAGFMRILHEPFMTRFVDQVINIHPSLLPAFKGLDAQQQAIAYGARITGATVHFVDHEIDHGPIIAQQAMPILENDDRDSLAARLLLIEHALVIHVLGLFAAQRVRLEGSRVSIVDVEGC